MIVSVGGCVYIKIIFGQGQSSQGFIVISAALESQVGFNYFRVNMRKLVFKTDFCLSEKLLPSGREIKCINSHTYSRELEDGTGM